MAAIKNPFSSGVVGYSVHRPTYPPSLATALAAQVTEHSHALDVGCGNGQLSVLLAEYFVRVTATDPSRSQLTNAFGHERVTYRNESAERMSVEDDSVDLIVAAQAAHWFDLEAFYREVRRVSRSGALLALVSYGIPTIDGEVGRVFADQYYGPLHDYWPDGRHHVENGYRDIAFPFPEISIAASCIERNWNFSQMEGYIGTWSCVRAARERGRHEIVTRFVEDLRQTWGDPDDLRRVTWPITVRAARLSK